MSLVKAKKHLGQHFLTDKNIAAKIVDSLKPFERYTQVLDCRQPAPGSEVYPGARSWPWHGHSV
jgi:hypothetical protein